MNGSFDRFTERARKVLTLAQEEAKRLNHNYIDTEHLLLGLVREGEGVAAKVLSNLGVDLGKLRKSVESSIGRGEHEVTGEVGLTPRAKKVIELAVDEARRLGHHYIGTEHLLLGLLREEKAVSAGVLESLGVRLDAVRSEVITVLTQLGSTPHFSSGRSARALAASTAAVRRRTWEYLTVETVWSGGMARVQSVNGHEDPRFAVQQRPIYEALQELGAEGWELSGIDAPAEQRGLYVLKRPQT